MDVTIAPRQPEHPDTALLLRDYMTEIVARWHGRPATPEEIEGALTDEPADGLRPPDGYLAVLEVDGAPVGIGALRLIDVDTAELAKVFVRPEVRGRGLASALLDHLEAVATDRSRARIRLDTRSDLAEACRLYERRGYTRVAPFSDCPYSDRWYARALCQP